MSISQRIYNADRAKEVLENEAFQQAFKDIEQELIEKWKTSPVRDEAGREKLFLMLSMLGNVEKCLKQTLDSGKLAAKELEYQKSLMERARDAVGWS